MNDQEVIDKCYDQLSSEIRLAFHDRRVLKISKDCEPVLVSVDKGYAVYEPGPVYTISIRIIKPPNETKREVWK